MALTTKGISYAVEDDTPAAVVARDLRAIREELHCTTVMLISGDVAALRSAARLALELGLDVYVRPYLPDRPRKELLAHLTVVATVAEELRAACPGRVTLLVGSEFSLTQRGMLPGPRLFVRVQVLVRWRRFFDGRIGRKLNPLLAAALATARASFGGPVTYAAGFWEDVDWSGFDVVGVNLYRIGTDKAAYEERLRELRERHPDKPLVITEFGCGAHAGAELRGPGSFLIVNWFRVPPQVGEGHVRDEATQAAYLGELIGLYEAAGVDGCFVYTFWSPEFTHDPEDPRRDLDMAGFGVVKIPAAAGDGWERKQAFEEVARRYAKP